MKITCRTCSDNIYSKKAVNLFESQQCTILKKIKILTDLWLENNNGLPTFICLRCQKDIERAMGFRERCISTQKNFTKDILSYSSTDENDPLTIECDDMAVKMEKDPDTAAVIERNNPLNNDENLIEPTIQLKEEQQMNCKYDGDEEHSVVSKDSEEAHKNVKKECENKTEKETTQIKSNREIICELCGRHFKSSSKFRVHMRHHTGIKNFTCDLCDAKFYTGSLMKKHRRIHTNEMPYKCKYCEQAFRNSNTKLKHERKHRNERPYNCQYCEKNFTTLDYLKNHHLTHTGIRNYHCDICNHSFLRLDHLRVHYKSQTHKKNETHRNSL